MEADHHSFMLKKMGRLGDRDGRGCRGQVGADGRGCREVGGCLGGCGVVEVMEAGYHAFVLIMTAEWVVAAVVVV